MREIWAESIQTRFGLDYIRKNRSNLSFDDYSSQSVKVKTMPPSLRTSEGINEFCLDTMSVTSTIVVPRCFQVVNNWLVQYIRSNCNWLQDFDFFVL
jgi:hypothetical protein